MALVSTAKPQYRQVFRMGRYAAARSVELLTYTSTPAAAIFASAFTSLVEANHPPVPFVRRLPDLPLVEVDARANAGGTIQ